MHASSITSNGSETEAAQPTYHLEKQSKTTTIKKKTISSASPLFCAVLPYHQNCPGVSSPLWWQNSKFSSVLNCLVVSSAFAAQTDCSLVSQLSTWIYIFIYTNQGGRASRADCLNSILAEVKIKSAVFEDWLQSKLVVWTMCMTLDYIIFFVFWNL